MLKCFLCLALLAAALPAADKEAKSKTEPTTPEKGKTPFGVFKGAAKAQPAPAPPPVAGSRKTPFGVFKNEGDSRQNAAAPAAVPGIRVVGETQDEVTFERKSPFGPSRWQRKKSEMDEDERSAWERSKSARE